MKLHPLAAAREAFSRAFALGSTVFFLVAIGSSAVEGLDVGTALVLAPVAALLAAAYGVAHYLRFSYAIEDETLAIGSGVFARTDRSIPLRRVQNVDLRQSFLQRLLGLAVLRVETAGGGQTEAVLDFVSLEEAHRLQRAIRERKGEATADGEPEPTPEPLFAIGDVELGLYALTSFRPASALFLLFAVPFGWDAATSVLLRIAAPLGGPTTVDPTVLASVAGLILALAGAVLAGLTSWAISALLTLVAYYGFRLSRTGDDLVYERGLLRRYSGSIPLSKVQTLTITEPALARPLGYAGLRVETAGYSRSGDRSGGRSGSGRPASAVPLAARHRALELARSVEPFGALAFDRPPRRARRRYAVRYLGAVLVATAVLYGIGEAIGGLAYWAAPLLLVPLVPVAAHLKWANRGYHAGPDYVALRDGFWRRRTRVVPYDRLQTVETRRTVFQRRLGLASLIADTASSGSLFGGAAVAYDVRTETARRLHRDLRDRLVAARAA